MSINFEEFQAWWEQNRHHYDEKSIEDMAEIMEDYKKWKTTNPIGKEQLSWFTGKSLK